MLRPGFGSPRYTYDVTGDVWGNPLRFLPGYRTLAGTMLVGLSAVVQFEVSQGNLGAGVPGCVLRAGSHNLMPAYDRVAAAQA